VRSLTVTKPTGAGLDPFVHDAIIASLQKEQAAKA
jgi:hypothetical protein